MKLRVRHELERRRALEPDPVCSSAWRGRHAAWTAPSSAPSTPFARNCCAAARWRRASIRSSRSLRSPTRCVFSPESSAAGSRRNCPRPPLPCRARLRGSPGGRNAIAASRSTNCAKPRGIWRSGAISTSPGKSAPFARDAHLAALVEAAENTLRIRSRTGQLPENFRPLREFVLRVQRAREAGLVDADRDRERGAAASQRDALGQRPGRVWLPPGKS